MVRDTVDKDEGEHSWESTLTAAKIELDTMTSHNPNSPSSDTTGYQEHMRRWEGQLNKFTNVVKGWQYRWFVLEPSTG